MPHRGYLALAWLCGVSLAAVGVVMIIDPPPGGARSTGLAVGFGAVSVVSVLLWRVRPHHLAARRFLVFGVLSAVFHLLAVATEHVPRALLSAHGAVGQVLVLAQGAAFFGMIAVLPDGGYARPWHRRLVQGVWLVSLAVPVLMAVTSERSIMPAPWEEFVSGSLGPSTDSNALFVPALAPLAGVAAALVVALDLVTTAVVLLPAVRYRKADALVRAQLRIIGLALAAVVLIVLSAQVASAAGLIDEKSRLVVSGASGMAALFILLAGLWVSITRHRLFEIEAAARRSLVHAVVWLVISLSYVGVAALLGVASADRLPVAGAVLVTILATIALRPLRERLSALASRRIYGDRPDAYDLLAEFGEGLQHAFDPSELVPRMCSSLREGLGVEWVEIRANAGMADQPILTPIGGSDRPDDRPAALEVPIAHAGQLLGVIRCGAKGVEGFTAEDRRLLDTLARQAALAFHNAALASELSARLDEIRRQADELTASRARLVAAQDAERRRIERNIHDGVQQEIASLLTKLRLARNQLGRSTELADATLQELQDEARHAMEEIRELARGIHPPVLADRGLLEAVEAKVARVALGVTIDATPAMRAERFGDDIEAAAYFFVSEALTNAVKHARATTAVVRLAIEGDSLVVEVGDNGVGFVPADVAAGGGLVGLRDRIAAVGGVMQIDSGPGRGTNLRATLPRTAPVQAAG